VKSGEIFPTPFKNHRSSSSVLENSWGGKMGFKIRTSSLYMLLHMVFLFWENIKALIYK